MNILKKRIPDKVKDFLSHTRNRESSLSISLRTATSFNFIGEAGPLVANVFEPLNDVPGWFNVDDCSHFYLTLALQSFLGIKGNLLEIGSYHGRSTAILTSCLRPDEKIVVCDAFEIQTDDQYGNKPSPEILIHNITRVNKEIARDQIVIHECLSSELKLEKNEFFRFIHIDGGHSSQQVYFDLTLCKKHLMQNGVMVIDDYHNRDWPGVTEGVDKFLADNDMCVLADLNRHGALGRKLYLVKE